MGFWDNILARGIDGHVQIAYGHHRLEALKRIKDLTEMVDIPVKTFTDATMIQTMANENMDDWKLGPKVIDETVKVTKKFLEDNPDIYSKYTAVAVYDPHYSKEVCGFSKFLNGNWIPYRVYHSVLVCLWGGSSSGKGTFKKGGGSEILNSDFENLHG